MMDVPLSLMIWRIRVMPLVDRFALPREDSAASHTTTIGAGQATGLLSSYPP